MTREERRRQVIKNRISLGFIIAELILICVLIPIAINKFGDKNNEDTPVVIDPNDEQAGQLRECGYIHTEITSQDHAFQKACDR